MTGLYRDWGIPTTDDSMFQSVQNSCFLLYTVVALTQITGSLSCMRSCPVGLYCPVDVSDCTSDPSKCVGDCFSYNVTHQGNGLTGECVDGMLILN